MKFHLRVYDNFHYGDESEAYNHGQYETYEDAMVAAKAIVEEFFVHNSESRLTAGYLLGSYCLYGEDPIIVPNEHGEHPSFSARTYAREIHETICKKTSRLKMETQALYQTAIIFATSKHLEIGQKVPGTDLPYVVHLSNVAMEILIASAHTKKFNLGFAVQVALLHDTIEDTSTTFDELENAFGVEIAHAVSALTKNKSLPKENQMQDSLQRIKKSQKEVWAVKLADRITNLQPPPPNWDKEKIIKYKNEARTIFNELQAGNKFLAKRLNASIEVYEKYMTDYFVDGVFSLTTKWL